LFPAVKEAIENHQGYSGSYISIEYNRGRQELRSVSVWDKQRSGVCLAPGWESITEFVMVERIRRLRSGKRSKEQSFYISSLRQNALYYATAIRSHWSIENGLHWVKDVSFREDNCRARIGDGALNLSVMRSIAINLFRTREKQDVNIASQQRKLANQIAKLKRLMH